MVQIEVVRQAGHIVAMTLDGHAETEDDYDNIVCASVSILAQTCVLGLAQVAGIDDLEYGIDDGHLSFRLPEHLAAEQQEQARIITETMMIGIFGTQEMHPQYIEICEREVRSDAFQNESSTFRQ